LYVYLSKLLPLMVLPVGLVIILLSAALLLAWLKRRRSSLACLAVALVWLWVCSTPFVAGSLYKWLEGDYPPMALDEIPTGDCIVVLGGAVGQALRPRVDVEITEATDRVYRAAQLYRAGKGDWVIAAAGNQPWAPTDQPEAEAIQVLLMDWGVPGNAIVLDGASRNTRENAVNSKALMAARECTTALLVTSAAHMNRSVAAFRKVGVDVVPVSTDIRVVHVGKLSVFDFLPSAGALAMTTDAMREWMGRKVYRWRGWN
jgi:uncharacterized SAM-binding protein YcdF (DUF218 family)